MKEKNCTMSEKNAEILALSMIVLLLALNMAVGLGLVG